MAPATESVETVAARMGRLVAATSFDALEPAVVAYTKDLVLSCVGAMVGGSTLAASQIVKAYAKRQGSAPRATVAGEEFRASAELAALANATFAHATEFEDDSFPEGVSTYTVIPPLMALAEEMQLDGKHLIAGIVAAHEIQSRLGRNCLRAHGRGYQLLPLLGTLGTAGGAALMMGLSSRQVTMAICISTSQAAGIRIQNQFMTHFLESGTAARAGLLSAYLAADGFDAADYVFEGLNGHQLGFLELLTGQHSDGSALFESWGSPYRILEVGIKEYPVCSLLHPMIQTLGSLRQRDSFAPTEIEDLEIVGNGSLAEVCDIPNPTTHAAASMSLQHVLASALVDGEVTMGSLSQERVNDPLVADIRGRIRLRVNKEYPPGFLTNPVTLTTTLKSGRVLQVEARTFHGLPPEFLSEAEVVAKFERSVADALPERRRREIIDAVAGLECLDDVGDLSRLLAHEPQS